MDLFPAEPTDEAAMLRGEEAEKEKGPVDLFPAEPTDEAAMLRGDLEAMGFKGLLPAKKFMRCAKNILAQ